MKIRYIHSDHSKLHLIEPLWNKLIQHHADIKKNSNQPITINTFQARSAELLKKAEEGHLCIIFALDEISLEYIGYCVCSIKDMEGEIDSIFVLDEYRNCNIGEELIKQSLEWFSLNKIKNISISVLFGNERAVKFYERFGFYLRSYIMKSHFER